MRYTIIPEVDEEKNEQERREEARAKTIFAIFAVAIFAVIYLLLVSGDSYAFWQWL